MINPTLTCSKKKKNSNWLKILGSSALAYIILNILFLGNHARVERKIYELHGKIQYENFEYFKQKGVVFHGKYSSTFFMIGGCSKYKYSIAKTPPKHKTDGSRLKYYESCIGHLRFKILGKNTGGTYRYDDQGRMVPTGMEYNENKVLQKINQPK